MVSNLEEFEIALKLLIKEKRGGLDYLTLFLDSNKEDQYFSELKEEFCKRYRFTEELFDWALKGYYAKTLVKNVEYMLKDPKNRNP